MRLLRYLRHCFLRGHRRHIIFAYLHNKNGRTRGFEVWECPRCKKLGFGGVDREEK